MGDIFADGYGWGYMIGFWVAPSDMDRIQEAWGDKRGGDNMYWDRTGRYGARAARSAPARRNEDAPLQVDALPDLTGYDVGVFYLSGRFKSESNKQ